MPTNPELAAAVAFIALGANFLAAALLLLFNPRSRAVRWFALFITAQVVWLLLQGLMMLFDLPNVWFEVYAHVVHFLPAVFFAFTIVHVYEERARWLPLLPLLVAALLLPVMGDPLESPLTMVWQAIGWGTPAVLHTLSRKHRARTRGGRTLNVILTLVVPFGVVGAILLEGGFVFYALPIMTIAIQLLIFSGIVYHSFYDIEVRAARSGELAAGAAEHDRLALLGELAATIAHEVRNPLTGIRSLAQRIGEEPLDDERRRRYTDVILGEISRLDRIVGNLTDIARRTSVNGAAPGAPTALAPLFEDLQLLVEARARRAGVSIVTAPAELVVHASREALAQALLNLLLNAVAHAPPDTIVELEAARVADGVVIRVRDQGPGIPAEQRARIFEPFHTDAGGTGLGLAVVRRLAQEHGWTVDVADTTARGAEFRVLLPAAAAS